jgi:hypothetical protein
MTDFPDYFTPFIRIEWKDWFLFKNII